MEAREEDGSDDRAEMRRSGLDPETTLPALHNSGPRIESASIVGSLLCDIGVMLYDKSEFKLHNNNQKLCSPNLFFTWTLVIEVLPSSGLHV